MKEFKVNAYESSARTDMPGMNERRNTVLLGRLLDFMEYPAAIVVGMSAFLACLFADLLLFAHPLSNELAFIGSAAAAYLLIAGHVLCYRWSAADAASPPLLSIVIVFVLPAISVGAACFTIWHAVLSR